MTIANYCVLIACLLPVATVGLAKISSVRAGTDNKLYNNHQPREWAERLQGWPRRANAAQQNGWEALPLFIAGVILAQQAHASQTVIDQLALAFIGLRLAYIAAYIADYAALRTLIWAAASGCSIALLLHA